MPLAGHTPIPARWAEHHRPVASGTHTGMCVITRPGTGEGTQDPDGTWHPPASTQVYSGPCRVTPQTADATYVVSGEERVYVRGYEVAIEWDAADVHEGDDLEVSAGQDPRISGMELRVMDVRHATETWERVLICEQNLTSLEA